MRKHVMTVRQEPPMHWVGDGFPVRTMFSYDRDAETMSPFLLLDYAAPAEFPPSKAPRGVGPHPHRGFETVTIAYQGDIEHRDSAGHGGRIGPGDVQWMTAASGVVHEEKFGRLLTTKGGTIEMVQLWVNLPAAKKMSAPRYQDLLDAQIPAVPLEQGAGTIRVIAGSFRGVQGPAKTHTPVELFDVTLAAGRSVEVEVPDGHVAAVLLLRGEMVVDEELELGLRELVVLGHEGDRVHLAATADARALLLAGEPLGEPVVGQGPFVMNTDAEIRQAFEDYQSGKMGSLRG